jgi:hypothetical protein
MACGTIEDVDLGQILTRQMCVAYGVQGRATRIIARRIMALEHQFTVLSDYLMADEHGRLTIAGTFTNVDLVSLPSKLPRLCVAVGFTGDQGDSFRVSLVDPDGEELTELGAAALEDPTVTDKPTIAVVYGSLIGFDLHKEGIYQVILWDGNGNAVHRRKFGAFLLQREDEDDGQGAD